MGKPKVLVGTPTFEGMDYCLDKYIEGLKSLTYDNFDVLIVDNSKTDEFFRKLKEKATGFNVVRDETSAELPVERIVSSRNRILDYALEKDYDYVLMIDADVRAPASVIQDLLKHKKDLVSGLYFAYFNAGGVLKILPVAWMGINEAEFEIIKSKVKISDKIKSHEDLQRHLIQGEVESDELLEVLYPSAGCLLISRNVFEKQKYELPKVDEKKLRAVSDDIVFIKNAKKLGFRVFVDTRLKCDHFLEGKFKADEKGNLIHPLNPDFYKAKG